MKRVGFYTLGCKVNQYETEAISSIFENAGYQTVDFESEADVYVINTCTVTGLSARKSRQMIRKAKNLNPDAVVVAVGCYAQVSPEEVKDIPGVNLVIGTKDRNRILEYISGLETGGESISRVEDIMAAREFEDLKLATYRERTRAYIKIQEGCTQFCAYCIIPYARGPVRSRRPEDVLDEVKRLSDEGFQEIVLTGIHIASYGRDIRDTSLMDIIPRIHEIDGIQRIRLGSIEPTTITPAFVEMAGSLPKLCPHYHISLQSGCDETLKRMNRKYTTGEYRHAVTLLREKVRDVVVTTDVMVGFPGETEEEFEKTYRFLKEIAFYKMHVFKFSPRKGTPAATFGEQVNPHDKEVRSDKVLRLSEENGRKYNASLLGRETDVLFEQEANGMKGFMEGLTANYIKVVCKGDNSLRGKICGVKLMEPVDDYIVGEKLPI